VKTAIITGASAGLGLEYVRQLEEHFPDVEQVWLIARNEEKLRQAAAGLKRAEGKVFPLDLCAPDGLEKLVEELEREQPDVTLLVNNAGSGRLGNIGETPWTDQSRMVELNVRALTGVSALAVPYMHRGGHIINVSSISSFCPNPRLTVYSASKAYVSAFSRGLGEELKHRGIVVTAVCSGPMATEFLDKASITGNSKTFELLPYCDPIKVVSGSYAAAKKGRAVYTPRAFYKFYRVVAKILPQRLMILFTKA